MNYTFNKKLVEQVKAGSTVVLYDPAIHSIDMLHALSQQAWPNKPLPETSQLTYLITVGGKKGWFGITKDQVEENELYCTHKIIPLSNFVQPEQSERDVMAELDEKIAKLEKMGAFEMLDFICSPTMSQRLAKLLNGEFKETPNDSAQLVGEPEIVNPVRWRAEWGQEYYYLSDELDAETGIERLDIFDDKRYLIGNYFQTTQQAEEMAVLMQFTLNNPELVKQLMDKKE